MQVDPDAGESMYLQIARELRRRIIDGELAVGEPLPSGREVHRVHGWGRNTYSQAVRELKRQGLVATRAGLGSYVVTRPELEVIVLAPGDQVAARAPDDDERERLGTGYVTPVLVITRAAGGQPEVYSAAVTVCRAATGPVCHGKG